MQINERYILIFKTFDTSQIRHFHPPSIFLGLKFLSSSKPVFFLYKPPPNAIHRALLSPNIVDKKEWQSRDGSLQQHSFSLQFSLFWPLHPTHIYPYYYLSRATTRSMNHRCDTQGCDASILLDETPSSEDVEKKAPQNGPFVRGFDVIDEIKDQLEEECPGAVSCADILAFANRDSLVYTGVPNYNVAAGRRDGEASLARNVDGNLPLPEATAHEMIQMFQKKGMSLEELVILIGAHSIGAAHCTVVAGRFHDPHKAKEMDRGYLIKMQTLTSCRNDSQDLPFDPYSHHKMDSRFYKELLKKQALLESDHNHHQIGAGRSAYRKSGTNQEAVQGCQLCSVLISTIFCRIYKLFLSCLQSAIV